MSYPLEKYMFPLRFIRQSGEVVWEFQTFKFGHMLAHDRDVVERLLDPAHFGFGEYKGLVVSDWVTKNMCIHFHNVMGGIYDRRGRKEHPEQYTPDGRFKADTYEILATLLVCKDLGLSLDLSYSAMNKYNIGITRVAFEQDLIIPPLYATLFIFLEWEKLIDLPEFVHHPLVNVGAVVIGNQERDISTISILWAHSILNGNFADDPDREIRNKLEEMFAKRYRAGKVAYVCLDAFDSLAKEIIEKKELGTHRYESPPTVLELRARQRSFWSEAHYIAVLSEQHPIIEVYHSDFINVPMSFPAWCFSSKLVDRNRTNTHVSIWSSITDANIYGALHLAHADRTQNWIRSNPELAQYSPPALLHLGIVLPANKKLLHNSDKEMLPDKDVDKFIASEIEWINEAIECLYDEGSGDKHIPNLLLLRSMLMIPSS